MEYIYQDDIISIDPNKIKSVSIENPSVKDIDDEYYVKIWFNWKWSKDNIVHTDGRQEFVSKNKSVIFSKIRKFISNTQKDFMVLPYK